MASRDDLGRAFQARRRQLWLVGGALRDELRRAPSGDADYATDALPDEIEDIAHALSARTTVVGRRFGTVGIELDSGWAEITTFRGDSYEARSRWPDVTFGRTIEEDVARRDFTVNALARDVHTGAFIDLYGGRDDLASRTIRAVGQPEQRFREDPLRILRAVRFVSQLGFTIEPATLAGMEETAGLLETLSQERVTAELDRTLLGPEPTAGLEALRACGGLEQVLPELAAMPGCDQNRFHHLDVWAHTLATVGSIAVDGESRRLRRWTALLHDIGKPSVRHRKPNGEWGFYRHETVGAEQAGALLERLRLGRREALVITLLVRRHMDRPNIEDARSVRRFMHRCEGHWRDLVALKVADNASHTYSDSAYHAALAVACERIERDEAAALRAESPLSGTDLIEMFGREPGPWIRHVKSRLSAMVLDGELAAGDRDGAADAARRLIGRQ